MSMIQSTAGLGYTTHARWNVLSFLSRCLVAFQEWRSRGVRLAELYDLDDRALMDIGIARGEIDYHIGQLDRPGDQ